MADRPRFYRQWLIIPPTNRAARLPGDKEMPIYRGKEPSHPEYNTVREKVKEAIAWVHHAQGIFPDANDRIGFEESDRQDALGFLWSQLAQSTHQVLFRNGKWGKDTFALILTNDLLPSDDARSLYLFLDEKAHVVPELAKLEPNDVRGLHPLESEEFLELLHLHNVGVESLWLTKGSLIQVLQREQGKFQYYDSVGGRHKEIDDVIWDNPFFFKIEAERKEE